MDSWISVKKALPETKEWVQVMTQDGTTYPAVYKAEQKVWSPVFRGGEVAQLYHGSVVFWQPHAEAYPMVTCECGRSYLQTPSVQSCPICSAFKGVLISDDEEKKPRGRRKKEPEE